MEDKKISWVKVISIHLLGGLIFFFLFFIIAFAGDQMQYKKVGETNLYIVETMSNDKNYVSLSVISPPDAFIGVKSGYICDAYWDKTIFIMKYFDDKTSMSLNDTTYFYITLPIDESSYYKTSQGLYNDTDSFNLMLEEMSINLSKMNHTDGNIPWSLHLFK